LLRSSMALTVFAQAFVNLAFRCFREGWPSTRPLKFLPSRTTTSVHVGPAVWHTGGGVSVAGAPAPHVGVGGRHHDAVGIGPVVQETFQDAAGALGDVGPPARRLARGVDANRVSSTRSSRVGPSP
jgi:hypothetical protein